MQNIITMIAQNPFVLWCGSPQGVKFGQYLCAFEIGIGVLMIALVVDEMRRFGVKDFFTINRFPTVIITAYLALVSVATYHLIK